VEFLETDDVLRMHQSIIDTGGGTHGVMAAGAVDAALERCRWGPFHGPGDLGERAAYLLRGIVQDHPFADGNKRTAFEVAETFLRRNGWFMAASADDIVKSMLDAAQGQPVEAIEAWIRARAKPLSSEGGKP